MDLSFLTPLLSTLGPWAIPVTIIVTILIQRLNLKLPTLPTLPQLNAPLTPNPQPNTPIKIDPLNLTDRPWLRALLSILAIKSAGSTTGEDAAVIDLLHRELTEVKDSLKSPHQINLR